MNQQYYDGVTKLEQMGASDDYILGWQSGFLSNPELEEQRVTDAYSAGREDGTNKSFDKADQFKK